jgi:hypothetical protein
VALAATAGALLVACNQDSDNPAPDVRPIRIITVERRETGVPIILTGRVEAEDEFALSFRISGRRIDNNAKLRDRAESAQVIAAYRLEVPERACRGRCRDLQSAALATGARSPFSHSSFSAKASYDWAISKNSPLSVGSRDLLAATRASRAHWR